MAGLRAALVAVMLLPVAVGCGANAAFPDPAACPSPAPPAAPSPFGRRPGQLATYRATLSQGVQQIETLRNGFRSRWPSDRPSNSSTFRNEFVNYADKTVCVATDLRDLAAPAPELEQFDTEVDGALSVLLDAMGAGRDAVRERNVSKYRDWLGSVDSDIAALKSAVDRFPR